MISLKEEKKKHRPCFEKYGEFSRTVCILYEMYEDFSEEHIVIWKDIRDPLIDFLGDMLEENWIP